MSERDERLLAFEQGQRVQVRPEYSILHANRYGWVARVVTMDNVRTLLIKFEDHRPDTPNVDWFMDNEVVCADCDDVAGELFT